MTYHAQFESNEMNLTLNKASFTSVTHYTVNLQFKTDSVLRVGQLFTNIGQYN